MFCVTLVNVLITLLLPVRGHPKSRFMEPSNRVYHPDRLHRYWVLVRIFHTISYGLPSNLLLFTHSIEIVLHSNLACRLVVGIREAGKSSVHRSDAFELSDIPDDTVVFARVNRRVPSDESSWVDVEAHWGSSQP